MKNAGCKSCIHLEKVFDPNYNNIYFCVHHNNFVKEPSYFGNTHFKESTLNKNRDCSFFEERK